MRFRARGKMSRAYAYFIGGGRAQLFTILYIQLTEAK
jgi:hypothetical protein